MYKVLIILFLASQFIVEAQGQVLVSGAGNESCGKWIETRNEPAQHYQYLRWIEGFISGVNWQHHGQQAHPPDVAAIVAFTDQYCKNNPLHLIVYAAAVLVQETGGPKVDPRHQWKR